ncbi:MAG: glucosamine-6-phosphate deaminase [Lentisphaeria bacterium]|nr:glucosamine-6-phosphate deaminase [Lentisphaeria bacterium]
MEVIITKDADEAAQRASYFFANLLKTKANAVLGLATGSTPLKTYETLIQKYKEGEISFKEVTSFNLDEYVGLSPDHPQSYRSFMNENLFSKVDIDLTKTFVPPGDAKNPLEAGPAYEKMIIEAGGIDLQLLGIGANGHIGFNEPTSSMRSRTRIKTLTEKTVKDNSRFFAPDEFQPSLAITMGIATILEARQVVLIATGEGKADAVAATIEGPLCAMCPASSLQLHENTKIIIDEAAASKLKLTEYYNYTLDKQDKILAEFS